MAADSKTQMPKELLRKLTKRVPHNLMPFFYLEDIDFSHNTIELHNNITSDLENNENGMLIFDLFP